MCSLTVVVTDCILRSLVESVVFACQCRDFGIELTATAGFVEIVASYLAVHERKMNWSLAAMHEAVNLYDVISGLPPKQLLRTLFLTRIEDSATGPNADMARKAQRMAGVLVTLGLLEYPSDLVLPPCGRCDPSC